MARKVKKICRHPAWVFKSHNDWRDGEYWTCEQCGTVRFQLTKKQREKVVQRRWY